MLLLYTSLISSFVKALINIMVLIPCKFVISMVFRFHIKYSLYGLQNHFSFSFSIQEVGFGIGGLTLEQ